MPDFRVIGQSPVPRANLGAEYDRGLGGATPGDFANLVTGLQEGLNFGSILDARMKETARDNDPAKLAQEQLERELKNEQAQVALDDSRRKFELDSEFERDERLIGLESKGVVNELNRSTTERQLIENKLKELYGADREEAEISALLNRGSYGRLSELTPRQRLQAMNEATDNIRQFTDQRNKIAPTMVGGVLRPGEVAPKQNLSTDQQQKLALIDSEIQNQQAILEQLRQSSPQAQTERYSYENQSAKDEFQRSVQDGVLKTKTARTKAANQALQSADQAAAEANSPYVESNVALKAWANSISGAVQGYKDIDDPEERAVLAKGLADRIYNAGPSALESYAESLQGEEKQNFIKATDAARAYSGDPNLLTKKQKDIQNAGLPAQYVADSQKTMATFTDYLKMGELGVDDSEFAVAMRGDPYIMAAQAALDRSPAIEFKLRPVNQDMEPIDAANAPAGSPTYVNFYDSAGNFLGINAPYEKNTKTDATLNMIRDFAKEQNTSVQQQQVAKTQGEILNRQNQNIRREVTAAPSQPQYGAGPATQQPAATQQQNAPWEPIPPGQPQPFNITPSAPQTQQAPAASAPQPTPTPDETKPLGYIYTPEENPGNRRALKYRDAQGNVFTWNKDYGVEYPENPESGDAKYKDPQTGATTPSSIRRAVAQNAEMKPLVEAMDERSRALGPAKELKDEISTYLAEVREKARQGIFGAAGRVPKLKADILQTLPGMSTKDQQEVKDLVSRGERLQARVLRAFLERGNVTSAANTTEEQKAIINSIMSGGMEFSALEMFEDFETNRIEKEGMVIDGAYALMSLSRNDPDGIRRAINDYENSNFSKPFVVNPNRFRKDGAKTLPIPGGADQPIFVENTPEVSDEPFMPLDQFLLLKGNDKRAPFEAAPIPTATPAPQQQQTPIQQQPQPARPGFNPQLKGASFRGDRAIQDPSELDGDVLTTPASFQEADIAEGEPSFFDSAGGNAPASDPREIQQVLSDTQLNQGGIPIAGSPPTQRDVQGLQDPGSLVPLDTRTHFEQSGRAFESPEEAQLYKGLLRELKQDTPENILLWLSDIATVNQSEELSNLFRKNWGIEGDLTERQIEMFNAAREQAIRELGETSVAASLGKFGVEGAAAIAQSLAVGELFGGPVLKAGQKMLPQGAVSKTLEKAFQTIKSKIPQAPKTLGSLSRGATNITRDAAVDAGLNTLRQSQPGDKPGTAAERFKNDLVLGMVIQGGGGLVAKYALPPVAREVFPAGRASDELIGARELAQAGMSREELEDLLAKTTGDLRDSDNPVIRSLGERLARDPATRPFVINANARRIEGRQIARENLEDAAGLDAPRAKKFLQQEYIQNAERFTNEAKQKGLVEANIIRTGAMDAADETTRKSIADAYAQNNKELLEAQQGLFNQTTDTIDSLVSRSVKEAEDAAKGFEEFIQTGQYDAKPIVRGTGQDLIPRLTQERAALQTARDNLAGTNNWIYSQLDDPINIETDLMDRLYRDFSDSINPEGRNYIAQIYKDVGGEPYISGLEGLEGMKLEPSARSLIEMRRVLQSKELQKTPQAKRLVKSIEGVLDEQMERAGKPAFKEFIKKQAISRQLVDNLDARLKILDTVDKELSKTASTGRIRDRVFGNRAEMRKLLGNDYADNLEKELIAVDDFNQALADRKAGKLSPEAELIETRGKKQAEYTRRAGERSALAVERAVKSALKESGVAVNADYFVKKLIDDETGLAERVAKSLGFADKTAFSEATMAELRGRLQDTLAKGNVGNIENIYQLFGFSKQSQFDNAMSMLTAPERKVLNDAFAEQMRVERGGSFLEYPVGSPQTGKPSGSRFRQAMYSAAFKAAAVADTVTNGAFKKMSVRDRRIFAEHVANDTPDAFRDYLFKVAENMKPNSAKAYANWLAYAKAVQVARAFSQGLTQPAETQATAQRRSLMRDISSSSPKGPTRFGPVDLDKLRAQRNNNQSNSKLVRPFTADDVLKRRQQRP